MRRGKITQALYSPYIQLQQNNTDHFVITQTNHPNFYMEQQDRALASQDFASLMLKDSVAQTTNTSGITWKLIYNSTNDNYHIQNWLDNTIYLGLNNIWYVMGGGHVNVSDITNTNVLLVSTGVMDEYYIKQKYNNITLTLSSITYDYSHETIGGVENTLTAIPMTWFEFPNLANSKFIIRKYDDTIDPILQLPNGGVYSIPSVDL